MNGPLSSLKTLDFSTLLPGPFAFLLLADMGAEVLRVESPSRRDLVSVLPPHDGGVSATIATSGEKGIGEKGTDLFISQTGRFWQILLKKSRRVFCS